MSDDRIDIVRADSRRTSDAMQTDGMLREEAFGREGEWSGFVTMEPGAVSGWHHHGEHITHVYIVSGSARFESGSSGVDADAGSFVRIPPRLVHRELNPGSTVAEAVVIRTGSGPMLFNVGAPDART